MKRKYFKTNDEYFNFYNKRKNDIEIESVYMTKKQIAIRYMMKGGVKR